MLAQKVQETSADEVVQKLRRMDGDGGGLFMPDREMARRVFAPPA